MRRDLERRLRDLENTATGRNAIAEFWIDESDGMVTGPLGERITREAFDLHRRDRAVSGAVLLLFYPEDMEL